MRHVTAPLSLFQLARSDHGQKKEPAARESSEPPRTTAALADLAVRAGSVSDVRNMTNDLVQSLLNACRVLSVKCFRLQPLSSDIRPKSNRDGEQQCFCGPVRHKARSFHRGLKDGVRAPKTFQQPFST